MTQLIVGQLLNGIIVGTLYGIIALGAALTLTFGITGIVNFALGAFTGGDRRLSVLVSQLDEIGISYPLAVPF